MDFSHSITNNEKSNLVLFREHWQKETNDTNILPSEDKLLGTPIFFSADDTLPDSSLLLFQESQFSASNSTTPIIQSAVTSVAPNLRYKENSNLNKHDLKDKRIKQLNTELTALKPFITEQLYVMKRMIKDWQGQKTTPNHSVVTEFLKKKMSYIRNENLTKT